MAASVFPEENVGKIIFQVKDDLQRLKLKLEKLGESAENDELKATIQQTENSLKLHADSLLSQLHCRVQNLAAVSDDLNTLGSEESANIWTLHAHGEQNLMNVSRTGPAGFLESRSSNLPEVETSDRQTMISMEPLHLMSPGDKVKRQHAARALFNPHNPRNRMEMNERYGIALPLINTKEPPKAAADRIAKGTTVGKLAVMKKPFPSTGSLEITELDARKGLLSLMERGLIPATAHVELDPPPVQNKALALNDFDSVRRLAFPADQTEPGFSTSQYQLDEIRVADISRLPGLPRVLDDVMKRDVARSAAKRRTAPTQPDAQGSTRLLPRTKSAVGSSVIMRLDMVNKEETEQPKKMPELTYENMFAPPPTTPASQASKHQTVSNYRFAIQNGRTRTDIRNYVLFKQNFHSAWGSIVKMIRLMEAFLAKYSIPLAFIDGNKLASLSMEYELEFQPSEVELLSCIVNRQDVEKLLIVPGRQFTGSNGPARAAVVIQSLYRGHLARKQYLHYRQQKWAAGVIAIRWLLYVKMNSVKQRLKLSRLTQISRHKQRFKSMSDNWEEFSRSKRVVIHIPSMAYPVAIRKKLDKFNALQNLQMCRICDLRDDNVDVIYVSPVPISDELLQYYSRLMGLKAAIDSGNVKDQRPITDRYKIIVPEAIKAFADHHMTLSTLLKYSPRALQRIKNIIQGRRCYIVPGLMHEDDLAIADLFNCPLIGSLDAQTAQLYSSKSGGRRIFAASGLPSLAPAECDIYNYDQLCEVLAVQITENLAVYRWLLKIDHEFRSRGIAYLDLGAHWASYKWALKERARYGDKWKKKWAQENVYNRILSDLPSLLDNHLVLVDKTAYASWNVFKTAFFSQGGIVEAYPYADSVTNLSVGMFIEPNGNIRVVSSGDQIHAQNPLSCWGLSVPQASIEADEVNEASFKVANACMERGIFGHVTIDFATFIDSDTNKQILWPTDLDVYYSEYVAMQTLALFSTNGVFDSAEHALRVPLLPPADASLSIAAAKKRTLAVKAEPKSSIQPRFVTMSCSLFHSNLAAVHYSVFFQMCRAHGIGYDVKEKIGTIFTLIDSFDRQNMGMLTIGDSFDKAMQLLARNLFLLHEEISSSKMQGKSNFRQVITEIEAILGQAVENMDSTS